MSQVTRYEVVFFDDVDVFGSMSFDRLAQAEYFALRGSRWFSIGHECPIEIGPPRVQRMARAIGGVRCYIPIFDGGDLCGGIFFKTIE